MISLSKAIIKILTVLYGFTVIMLLPMMLFAVDSRDGLGLAFIISMLVLVVLLYLKENILLDENKRPKELEELFQAYEKWQIDRISFFKSVINTISFLNLLLFIATIFLAFFGRYLWLIIFGLTGAILFYLKIRLIRVENKKFVKLESDT